MKMIVKEFTIEGESLTETATRACRFFSQIADGLVPVPGEAIAYDIEFDAPPEAPVETPEPIKEAD